MVRQPDPVIGLKKTEALLMHSQRFNFKHYRLA